MKLPMLLAWAACCGAMIPTALQAKRSAPGEEALSQDVAAVPPSTFLLDGHVLMAVRHRALAGDPTLADGLKELRRRADRQMGVPLWAVTNKPSAGPSGDKHDYVSLASYHWPDPAAPTGLPYILRDGELNPETHLYDRERLDGMCESVHTLALAYYLTNETRYARRAAEQLRTWFLDPATRMNPHLRNTAMVKGLNDGTFWGLIQTEVLPRVVDGVALLRTSGAWPADDDRRLRQWFAEYLTWLLTSEMGKNESIMSNNHGTMYDVQTAVFALFTDQKALAAEILETAKTRRIAKLIEPDGRMPSELVRTRSWTYSSLNLTGMFRLAQLGGHVGVDLWHYRTTDGRSIRGALDWMFPYICGKPWTHRQITRQAFEPVVWLLRQAATVYGEPAYERAIAGLPRTREKSEQVDLELLLMNLIAPAPGGNPRPASGQSGEDRVGVAADFPPIDIREEAGSSRVYWEGQCIVDIKENRFLRFRASPRDELWVGTERAGADLGWAYADMKAKGMKVLRATSEIQPDNGGFLIRIEGEKPQFPSRIEVLFRGQWMPEVRKFQYTLSTRLSCGLEDWYLNSRDARPWLAGSSPETGPSVEVIDYTIEYGSVPTRHMSASHKQPQIYEWFVKSADGVNWLKWPKISIPFPTRPGRYITIEDTENPARVGGYYGFLDHERGGWMTRILKAPGAVSYGLCWSQFDVHTYLLHAIPPRYSAQNLALEFELEFKPVEAPAGRAIVQGASELNWRGLPEYQLPLFSRHNRFDRLITEVPGEDTAHHYPWWASSYECFRDDTTGYDDHYSVSIKREKPSSMPVAWNCHAWDFPFEAERLDHRRFRLTAMVKTKDCTGQVRIGIAGVDASDLYYGTKTHNPDGSYRTDWILWDFSPALTGTNDWTPLTLEFTVRRYRKCVILEQSGTGQAWFDNVVLEDLGEAAADGKAIPPDNGTSASVSGK